MIRNFMIRFRRRPTPPVCHVPNGNGQPSRAEKDAEFERRVVEETRRYESDLRRLAKT
ncbi:MAG: hypothetical protein M3340_14500 [Actinomycetota bacterium]|nr:hypothetical protein [Actinomycetota bacterium]